MMLVLLSPLLLLMPLVLAVLEMNKLPLLVAATLLLPLLLMLAVVSCPAAKQHELQLIPSSLQLLRQLPAHSAKSSSRWRARCHMVTWYAATTLGWCARIMTAASSMAFAAALLPSRCSTLTATGCWRQRAR
jgi:hypothetical protein